MGKIENIDQVAPVVESACRLLYEVRSVNELVQGLCSRLDVTELSKAEGEGLFHLLDWQNQKIKTAESILYDAKIYVAEIC